MKKNRSRISTFFNYLSTAALVLIIIVLLVPGWRVAFQGWYQGLFMKDTLIEQQLSTSLPASISQWKIESVNQKSFEFSDFYDTPIILSFWATWCPPCRAELKNLASLKEQIGQQISIISVTEESIATIKNSGLNKDYDFLYRTKKFPPFFNINAYPTLCIINTKQELIFQQEGVGNLNTEKNIRFLRDLVTNE